MVIVLFYARDKAANRIGGAFLMPTWLPELSSLHDSSYPYAKISATTDNLQRVELTAIPRIMFLRISICNHLSLALVNALHLLFSPQ
jgi:hypothetical protein